MVFGIEIGIFGFDSHHFVLLEEVYEFLINQFNTLAHCLDIVGLHHSLLSALEVVDKREHILKNALAGSLLQVEFLTRCATTEVIKLRHHAQVLIAQVGNLLIGLLEQRLDSWFFYLFFSRFSSTIAIFSSCISSIATFGSFISCSCICSSCISCVRFFSSSSLWLGCLIHIFFAHNRIIKMFVYPTSISAPKRTRVPFCHIYESKSHSKRGKTSRKRATLYVAGRLGSFTMPDCTHSWSMPAWMAPWISLVQESPIISTSSG